jgi:hypothetical protein
LRIATMQGRLLAAARWLAATLLVAFAAPAAASGALYTVTTPDDAGSCDGTLCASLRAALAAAGDGDTIRLPAYPTPYVQRQGPFVIAASVALVGDGADRTVIAAGTGRTFQVGDPQAPQLPTVVMAHLQVTGGHDEYGYGGNVLNYADLTLDHVRVTGGQAGSGGGVANLGAGSLEVSHSLIDHNRAISSDAVEEGGGLYSDSSTSDALVVRDSTIAYNDARSGAGLAIGSYATGEAPRSAVLERVTIARNRALGAPAGGLSIGADARVAVTGSLLAENTVAFSAAARAAAVDEPSNCGAQPPYDAGGNLAYPDDCGLGSEADPQLSAQLVEGLGETPVLTLQGSSPAVDLAGACVAADQRDLPRPQGVACDAGAYEVAAPVIGAGPSGRTGDASPAFAFASPDPGAAFECRLDGPGGAGTWEACVSPKTYSSLAPGSYTFIVRAAGASAEALRAFSVASTPLPLPPPPAAPSQAPTPTPTPAPRYRQSVVVKPTKGTVKVRLPATKRYVALDRLDRLPLGASIDVRKGRIRLYAASDGHGGVQAASFYGGVFRVVQRGRVIELQLRGPRPVCATRRSATASADTKKAKKTKRRTRKLWGSGRGRFRTRGQYSAATVRGTIWLVEDSCRSTTTRVKRGVVKVRDLKRRRTIVLRAGDRYVARKR